METTSYTKEELKGFLTSIPDHIKEINRSARELGYMPLFDLTVLNPALIDQFYTVRVPSDNMDVLQVLAKHGINPIQMPAETDDGGLELVIPRLPEPLPSWMTVVDRPRSHE